MYFLNNLVTEEMWVGWADCVCEILAVPPGWKVVSQWFEVLTDAPLGGVRDQYWSKSCLTRSPHGVVQSAPSASFQLIPLPSWGDQLIHRRPPVRVGLPSCRSSQ